MSGHEWHMLISRREVKNSRDIDVSPIGWEIHDGVLKPAKYWETHVTHPTEHLEINVIFPKAKHPRHVMIVESNRRRSHVCGIGIEALLPDDRCLARWGMHHPRL